MIHHVCLWWTLKVVSSQKGKKECKICEPAFADVSSKIVLLESATRIVLCAHLLHCNTPSDSCQSQKSLLHCVCVYVRICNQFGFREAFATESIKTSRSFMRFPKPENCFYWHSHLVDPSYKPGGVFSNLNNRLVYMESAIVPVPESRPMRAETSWWMTVQICLVLFRSAKSRLALGPGLFLHVWLWPGLAHPA